MLKLKAKENYGKVIKDNYYYIEGMIQNEDNVVLMDIIKNIIPGKYPCQVFGYSRDEI